MDRHSRIDLPYNIFLTADDMDNTVDIVAMTTFTGYCIHSQRMLGKAQHRKLRSLSANQIGIK